MKSDFIYFIGVLLPILVITGIAGVGAGILEPDASIVHRSRRAVDASGRSTCSLGQSIPPTRVDSTQRASALLNLMKERNLSAYIVLTGDEHLTEYVSEWDKRRHYLTGFKGSAGSAVVLSNGLKALWTDGRYFLAADDQLDCSWILMRQQTDGVPSILEWLKKNLKESDVVGTDPRLIGAERFQDYEKDLKESGITLEAVNDNLIDLVWPDSERPPKSDAPIEILELKFAGKRWQDKVNDIRAVLREKAADLQVVTALDEVAWLFNLRGRDINYTPVFRSYAIVGLDKTYLFLDSKVGADVDLHLHVNDCEQECVEIHPYKSITETLRGISSLDNVKKVLLPAKLAYDGGASYAIVSSVNPAKRFIETSPLLYMKAAKNEVERNGMKNAHIKDAVALIDFLSLMDEEIPAGKNWNELSAASKLEEFRRAQEDNRGLSFETISAFGSNGAVIHYKPVESTNKKITDQNLYLLDSGGQYKDGTTDVTRTLHYGTPTAFQKEAYTRVLMGAVDLATLVFPNGTTDARVDVLARKALFEVGLNYKHGTGHGIGMFLFIHESPTQVRIYGKKTGQAFRVGYFFSDEPGYYKPGEFGIRLETILGVVEAETKYESEETMLAFEPVTLVPFERKLIDINLLSKKQCYYVNNYHDKVMKTINPILVRENRRRASKYLMAKAAKLDCGRAMGGTSQSGKGQLQMEVKGRGQMARSDGSAGQQVLHPLIIISLTTFTLLCLDFLHLELS